MTGLHNKVKPEINLPNRYNYFFKLFITFACQRLQSKLSSYSKLIHARFYDFILNVFIWFLIDWYFLTTQLDLNPYPHLFNEYGAKYLRMLSFLYKEYKSHKNLLPTTFLHTRGIFGLPNASIFKNDGKV